MATHQKYLPTVKVHHEKDLVITMEGYNKFFPGNIYIVGGAQGHAADKLQLLLGHAIMDLAEYTELHQWKVIPKPILVPEGTIYTIAKEDVEDNTEIRVVDDGEKLLSAVFNCVRNGSDLYVTNIIEEANTDEIAGYADHFEITTIVITDFFEDDENTNKRKNKTLPNKLSGITFTLPGLNIILREKECLKMQFHPKHSYIHVDINISDDRVVDRLQPAEILEWKAVLHQVEKSILKDYSDVPREFQCDDCSRVQVLQKTEIQHDDEIKKSSRPNFWELF